MVGFFDHWARRLTALAEVQPGERVLDIGCGPGTSSLPAVEAGATVLGLDLSPEMVALARQRVPSERAEFEVADADSFVVAPMSYDVVLCGFLIMFVEDQAGVLGRIHDALRPGGRAVVSVPDADLPTPRARKTEWAQRLGFARPRPVAVGALATEAGLQVVSERTESCEFEFSDGAAYLDWIRSHGGRMIIDQLTASELAEFEAEQVAAAEADRRDDGRLVMETKATFWVATRQ